jgi:hypothetical protein
MQNYIKDKYKPVIKKHCEVKIANGEQIRVKTVALMLGIHEEYALYEIANYLKHDLNVDSKYIFRGEADYISTLPRGHIQFTGMDLYYPNVYLHQYVVCKELNVDIGQVKKYIVHHVDQNKGNNDISNLWLFYDIASHIAYHQAIKHGVVDIKEFTEDYIESILDVDNQEEIKQYIEVLEKLQKSKNTLEFWGVF